MSGPKINRFGDVISSGLNMSSLSGSGVKSQFDQTGMLRGQITAVYNVDHKTNKDIGNGPAYTLYDVLVTRGNGHTELVTRCRAMQPLSGGSINNYHEVVMDVGLTPKEAIDPALKKGTVVVVAFLDGHKNAPVIIGSLPHTSKIAQGKRPKKSKGAVMAGEFEGLEYSIDKDGLSIVYNGPKDDLLGIPKDPTLGPTSFKIDKSGNISIKTNKAQEFTIDRVTGTATIKNGLTTIKSNQLTGEVTIEADKVNVTAKKEANVKSLGPALVQSISDLSLVSKKTISMGRDASSGNEAFVLGNVFVTMMSQLLSAIGTHTHLGNMGLPTSPPLNAAQFTQINANPISNGQILSTLIKGEK